MSEKSKSEDDDMFHSGYGKPPKHTQFRKGESGNPRGRPKGRLNLATVIEQILREKVVINDNGVPRTVTKFEAALKQLADKATGGDIAAIRQLMAFAVLAGLETSGVEPRAQLSNSDLKLMNRVLERLQQSGKGQTDDKNE